MKKQKGFTLIEILIVVVILAVLATLVLPRMLTRPEGALLAEANQELGSLARGQDAYMQLSGNTAAGLTVTRAGGGAGGEATSACDAACTATWAKVGLQPPTNARFSYSCDASTCTAFRTVGATASSAVLNYTTRTFTSCTGAYTLATEATRGCVLAG